MHVFDLDHIVLNVADVERSLAWYVDRLGLAPVRVAEWRAGTAPFPSVRVNEATIIDLMALPRSGHNVDHFCLVTDEAGLRSVLDGDRLGPADGPYPRFGARGEATSVYVRDPDGNVVELRTYPS